MEKYSARSSEDELAAAYYRTPKQKHRPETML